MTTPDRSTDKPGRTLYVEINDIYGDRIMVCRYADARRKAVVTIHADEHVSTLNVVQAKRLRDGLSVFIAENGEPTEG